MNRVIVIGCPGSGKSTFSRRLHEITQIPLFHLDLMFWNADKTTVERPIFLDRLQKVMDQDRWIIDGNYSTTMKMRMEACDTIFFLDYDVDLCLGGIRDRRGKPRGDMPWIESGEEDRDFLSFVRNFHIENRPIIMELLENFRQKTIVVFHNREECHRWLSGL